MLKKGNICVQIECIIPQKLENRSPREGVQRKESCWGEEELVTRQGSRSAVIGGAEVHYGPIRRHHSMYFYVAWSEDNFLISKI